MDAEGTAVAGIDGASYQIALSQAVENARQGGALVGQRSVQLGDRRLALPVQVRQNVGFALVDRDAGTARNLEADAVRGAGLATKGPIHGWNGIGTLTPITRYETMFSGVGMQSIDGTEWYFPQRLTDDTAAVDNGNGTRRRASWASTPRWATRSRRAC